MPPYEMNQPVHSFHASPAENPQHVFVRCLVRRSKGRMKCDYGDEHEMVCILINQSSLRNLPEGSSESEGQFVNNNFYHTTERDSASITSMPSFNISPRPVTKGPMLRFKYVPQPPSRPTSRIKAPTGSPGKRKQMSSPQKSISHPCRGTNVAGVYNDPLNSIPSKIHLRAMSPGPQTSYGGGYKSRSPMTSAHAATLFNVKSETDESHSNDKKAQTPLELYLSDIIAVDIMPDPAAVDVNLMYITTKTIGFLQLAFHKLLDQEILLAFFKASLSEGVISRHDDRLQKLACTKTVESQVNMDNFTARAVKGRFLNESLWERTKRRMARYATKASEVCACGNIYEQYAYEEKLEADSIDGQTVQTKMELDDPNTRISLSSGSGDNEKVTASLIENRDDSEESPVLLVVR